MTVFYVLLLCVSLFAYAIDLFFAKKGGLPLTGFTSEMERWDDKFSIYGGLKL
jgi:hypothetical protein